MSIRASAGAERTADLVVSCTGGVPTGTGQTVQPMTWILTFNTAVTSRPLAQGWSDALLIVDEPQIENQTVCINSNGLCTITGTGTGVGTYSGAPARPNVFQGATDPGPNVLIWRGIPFDPSGSGARVFRFTNIRVPTNEIESGANVQVSVEVSGQIPVTINNATRTLATARPAFSVAVPTTEASSGRLSRFTLAVTELFGNVFKPYSLDGPVIQQPQADPGGASHASETGFFNPFFPSTARGQLNFAGLPDSGTRLRVRMTNVPQQVTVTAPLSVSFGVSGLLHLITADSNGRGTYTQATTGTLTNNNGTVIAVYEVAQAASGVSETANIAFTLTHAQGAPALQLLDGDVALAPENASPLSSNSPIPRFIGTIVFRATAPRDPLAITTTSLLNGAVGAPYTQTIEGAGGLQPYTFTSTPTPPAPGLFLQTGGQLSGTPATAGTFQFTVTLRDSAQAAAQRTFSLTIGSPGSALQTSVSQLEFNSILDGVAPPQQAFRITSPQAGQSFTITVDSGTNGSSAPSWIQVSPLTGGIPSLITVAVNQANLPEGTFAARIRLSVAGNPNLPPVIIPVTLIVRAVAQKLESSASILRFEARASSPRRLQGSLVVRNAGGGAPVGFSASVMQASSWITSITPGTGNAGPLGIPVRVNLDSTGLPAGIYRDVIRFAASPSNIDVPIVLRVAPTGPQLDVSPAGIRFSAREGAQTLASREIRIFNRDTAGSISWTAEMLRGAEYFALSVGSGSASATAPGSVRLSPRVETSSLAAGNYYGLVRINAPGVPNAPRYITAVLEVRSASQPAEVDIDPGGAVLLGIARSTATARRTFTFNVATPGPTPFQAAASTIDGASWLSVTPSTGSISSAGTVELVITADPRNLAAGIYRGEVTVVAGESSQTIAILFIVTDASTEQPSAPVRAATCVPNRMAVGTTGLANNFAVPAGWPATLSVEVRDNCGTAISNATVVARFSNGDPPMTLDADDLSGAYSATWQPGTAAQQANVTISALTAEFPEARASLVGSVRENKVPTLFRNGTIHNLDPKLGGLLSPGLVAQVYGTDLASVSESTGSVPLSKNYKGTSVLVGPYEAPLYYVSPGQLVVQLPSELDPNRTYPILVTANGAITVPDEIDFVTVQPGVAAFPNGRIIAQHADFRLVDVANPAQRGEILIMYLVGLGATNPPVASGAPSPGTAPLGTPTTPATVTIDGVQVETVFTGLTPGGVGLYQINFRVPQNIRLNTPVDVVVKQGSYTSNTTQIMVVP